MAACDQCGGAGSLATGRYQACYRCGGSGHGGHTNQACIACGGAGTSTTEIRDTCWRCSGSGMIADPKPASAPAKSSSGSKKSASSGASNAPAKKGQANQIIAGLAGAAAVFVALAVYGETQDPANAIGAGIVAFIGGYLLLWLAYGLLQLAVIVAFWGAILIIIGNFAGWQWAEEVVALITG